MKNTKILFSSLFCFFILFFVLSCKQASYPTTTVSTEIISSSNVLKEFSFPKDKNSFLTIDEIDEVNQSEKTVKIVVPFGSDLTNLIAVFSLSESSSLYVDDVLQVSGETVNDFSSPIICTVKKGETSTDWTVTVECIVPLSNFYFASETHDAFSEDIIATIDSVQKTVSVEVPTDDVTALVPTFSVGE